MFSLCLRFHRGVKLIALNLQASEWYVEEDLRNETIAELRKEGVASATSAPVTEEKKTQ